jgi:hypothetical protein
MKVFNLLDSNFNIISSHKRLVDALKASRAYKLAHGNYAIISKSFN